MPQAFYRRKLPHLQCDDRQHFITFCTRNRWILPERARSIVLECCLRDNGIKFDLKVAVVMPDHVHMIFTPLVNRQALEVYSLAEIMDAIKGASAHKVNKLLGCATLNRAHARCRHSRAGMFSEKSGSVSGCRRGRRARLANPAIHVGAGRFATLCCRDPCWTTPSAP